MGNEPSGFSFRATKTGKVFIEWQGIAARTLAGSEAAQFLAEVEHATELEQQLLMARKTGNFKRGNEHTMRRSKKRQ